MKVIPSFFASKVDTDDNDLGHEEKETNRKNDVVNTPNRRGHDIFFNYNPSECIKYFPILLTCYRAFFVMKCLLP